jgi:hypothetical protein
LFCFAGLKDTISCTSWGDPHFSTFAGQVFDFLGYGEYTLTKLNGLEVQVRQAPCSIGATCIYGVISPAFLSLLSSFPICSNHPKGSRQRRKYLAGSLPQRDHQLISIYQKRPSSNPHRLCGTPLHLPRPCQLPVHHEFCSRQSGSACVCNNTTP